MAQNPSITLQDSAPAKVLILSDGKPGHVNQSVAFARLSGLPFEVCRVSFCNRFYKAISYCFDRLGLSAGWLFNIDGDVPECSVVVSTGSETYYANRVLARSRGWRSVAIMLPRGYRYDFDLIVAQQHDWPPIRDNILTLPVNLSCTEPQGLVTREADKPCISLIIGGPSRHYRMAAALLEQQMQQIFNLFPGADFMVTSSRRTPPEVEALLDRAPFRYKVIASRQAVNPIPDFLAISDYVFVTEDSTSMISEAVCFGQANVEVLPLAKRGKASKIQRMIGHLQQEGYLHVFDGFYGKNHRKLDLQAMLRKAWP
ncbi:MAG: ELM1/GtrOC1 family putative glycosyltransferase [Desulfuromonadales bacterium]